MHSKSIRRAFLLTALAALVPWAGAARAQQGDPIIGEPQIYGDGYSPADPVWPFPLYSTHPENGGLFVAASFVSYRQTNPLHSQNVAVRGFQVTSPVIAGVDPPAREPVVTNINSPFFDPLGDDLNDNIIRVAPSGTFVGSGTPALDVNQVRGNQFEPGTKIEVGWKFGDGSSITVSWLYISEVNLGASATLAPRGGNVGPNFADSFLFAPVFNFPNDFAGPTDKVTAPNPEFGIGDNPFVVPAPGLAFGIWNGAGIMTEQFLQRTQQWDVTYRAPIYETENYRISGLVGPRYTWIWERYKWTTTALDTNSTSEPEWTAQYSNVASNRLYGLNFGCQQECYIGHGFALDCTLACQLYADSAKTIVKYQLARGAFGEADPGPVAKRGRHYWEFSPAAEAKLGVMWYPIEGVQVHAGYDFQGIFDTITSYQPIDFNFGAVDPRFVTHTIRTLDGLDLGIALIF